MGVWRYLYVTPLTSNGAVCEKSANEHERGRNLKIGAILQEALLMEFVCLGKTSEFTGCRPYIYSSQLQSNYMGKAIHSCDCCSNFGCSHQLMILSSSLSFIVFWSGCLLT